jgi:hypothetical protein
MPEITPDTLVARSPSVVTSEVDGEILMMSIEQGRYFGLNDVAGDLWERLGSPRPFGELVAELGAMHERDVIELRDPAA